MDCIGTPQAHQVLKNVRAIADDRYIRFDILIDGRRVDVDMDFLRPRRKRVEPARDPIVKARADADHHVAIMHRHVGFERAVHAQHADPFWIGRRKCTESHQRRCDRKACELDEFAQQVASRPTGIDHAATRIEQRTLGVRHQIDRLLDLVHFALEPGLVAGVRKILWL